PSSLFCLAPATVYISSLSLHDALPIYLPARILAMSASLPGALLQDAAYALRSLRRSPGSALFTAAVIGLGVGATTAVFSVLQPLDRKSTRLNSSHVKISYAVFCLKKKK